MARASRAYSPSSRSSGATRGRRKPSGSRSASRYPHWRKALKTRSRSGFVLLFSTTAVLAPPLEGLDFGVGIVVLTRITDAARDAGDSGLVKPKPLPQGTQGKHFERTEHLAL